jgi:regulatory protein YycH of two-component signal transduction system YycFG
MIDKSTDVTQRSRYNEPLFQQAYPSLTLESPNVEEIARVIWQRQHDTLPADAFSHNVKWRDQSIPSKFWDEFLLDAHAVLMLLYEKHDEAQSARP